jgi:hypothetical protein
VPVSAAEMVAAGKSETVNTVEEVLDVFLSDRVDP